MLPTVPDFFDTSNGTPPYLIAEIGVNHFDIADQRGENPMKSAKRMVTAAAEAGVDAVKFQSYDAESLSSTEAEAYWDTDEESTTSQYDLFESYDAFGEGEFTELAKYTTEQHGVDFLSTPFDKRAVDYLTPLVPVFKIASADITNFPLLRYIASKGKPILLSTGASTVGEVDEAVRVIHSVDESLPVVVLHCVLEYPTDPENANLGMIEHLAGTFPDHAVGYSDHVRPDDGMVTLLNAVNKGASVVEKHFTLDKSLPGNDHYHAMSPDDVETFRQNTRLIERTNGASVKQPIDAELDARTHARRSLVASEPISRGETISKQSVTIKRPGTGISPSELDTIVGRQAQRDIDRDSVIQWGDL